MANSNNDNASKIQLASLTLILLVKYFRSQMISLLVRNGVFVTDRTTNEQIIKLMTTLLKVSKSFNIDLNNFLQNPKVLEVLAKDMQGNAEFYKTSGNAQYFRMSGNRFLNITEEQELDDIDAYWDSKVTEEDEKKEESGSSWWSSIKENLGTYIGDGIKLVGALDTNRTNRDIANARAKIAQAESEGKTFTPKEKQDILDGKVKDDKGVSVTTIVVLSLVGVVTLGTIIFLATRSKN